MAEEIKWSIDKTHSSIVFKVRHLMISDVEGSFKIFDGSIYTTGKDFTTAVIDVFIDATSINTGDEIRDEHLKSFEFLDTQAHKQINFVSNTIVEEEATRNYILWGELTMRGLTKKVKFEVIGGITKDPYGQEKAEFTITGKISRSEWGLVWNAAIETGGLVVSDSIAIVCKMQLINSTKRNLHMKLEDDVALEVD
jgi:polyisoprenoid-binding protein YceI